MSLVKKLLKYAITMLYVFFSSYNLYWFLSVAFNFTKGIANNPDGKMFIPFGIIIVLTIFIITFLTIRNVFKNKDITKAEKITVLTIFSILIIMGILLSAKGWRNFFSCLLFYLSH